MFFYGTMETAFLSRKSMVNYQPETKSKYVAKFMTRPKYLQAVNELENKPEIAFQ